MVGGVNSRGGGAFTLGVSQAEAPLWRGRLGRLGRVPILDLGKPSALE